MGTDNETPDLEQDYEAAFDEAIGDVPAEEAAEGGDETATADDDAASKEGADATEGGEEEIEAVAADDAASQGSEEEAEDSAAEDDEAPAAEGSREEPEPARKQPEYDAEAVKAAADIIRQQQEAKAAESRGQEAKAAEDEKTPPKTIDDYVPEDKRGVVEKYRQEWSEVAEAEQLLRAAHLQQVQEQIYSELRGALAPVFETTQRLQVNAHQEAIRKAHPDLDEVKEDLYSWIAEQPDFVRPAYEQVAEQGSAQQVVELINFYKQAKGATGAVPAVPASSARTQQKPATAKKQPPAAAKKALAAAPSPSKVEAPGSADPDNFDAAFDEAVGLG